MKHHKVGWKHPRKTYLGEKIMPKSLTPDMQTQQKRLEANTDAGVRLILQWLRSTSFWVLWKTWYKTRKMSNSQFGLTMEQFGQATPPVKAPCKNCEEKTP